MQKLFYPLIILFLLILNASPLQAEVPQPIVVFETSQGNFEVKLWPTVAPKATENFLALTKNKYYDESVFHRVIKDFMIQGGDPTATGRGGQSIWDRTFEDEVVADVKFDKPGLIAMANRGPNTNGSQFFITTSTPDWLNQKHTIFGEVIKGYEVIKKIENSQVDSNSRPLEAQTIYSIYIKE